MTGTERTIDGACPNCGRVRLSILASGLWDGWGLPDYHAASGISLYGKCHRCGAILASLAEDAEDAQSMVWSIAEEDTAEWLERSVSARKHWWQFWRRA
jgi:hypothetical protein